jgi:hypothetical protein
LHQDLVQEADAEAQEHRLGIRTAVFADDQHLGAGSSLGVGQYTVLLDDERLAQGNHHEDAEQAAQHGHEHHPGPFQLVAQEHQRGHGRADAESD